MATGAGCACYEDVRIVQWSSAQFQLLVFVSTFFLNEDFIK
jgi:hypothetical protein